MTRRSLLSILALSLPAVALAKLCKASSDQPGAVAIPAAPAPIPPELKQIAPAVPRVRAGADFGKNGQVSGVVLPPSNLSGPQSGGGSWCMCPNCHGVGFVGEDKDQCGYCKMSGTLWTEKHFGMGTPEGNAEVLRAPAWQEWGQSHYYSESKGPKPNLAGMLYSISREHPEVCDPFVRENIFKWLAERFGEDYAKAQHAQIVESLKNPKIGNAHVLLALRG